MTTQPSDPNFVPRKPPWWSQFFADWIVGGALIIVWGSAAWAMLEVLRGQMLRGVVSFAIWLPLFILIVRALHRRGTVRLSVSITTTAIFIMAVAAVIAGFL